MIGLLLISSLALPSDTLGQDATAVDQAESAQATAVPEGMMTDDDFLNSSAATHNAWMLVAVPSFFS